MYCPEYHLSAHCWWSSEEEEEVRDALNFSIHSTVGRKKLLDILFSRCLRVVCLFTRCSPEQNLPGSSSVRKHEANIVTFPAFCLVRGGASCTHWPCGGWARAGGAGRCCGCRKDKGASPPTRRIKAPKPEAGRPGSQRPARAEPAGSPAAPRRPRPLLHDAGRQLLKGGGRQQRVTAAPQPVVPTNRRLLLGLRHHAAGAGAVRGGRRWQPRAHVHRVAQPVPEEHVELRAGRAGLLGLCRALLLPPRGRLSRAHPEEAAGRPVLPTGALPGGEILVMLCGGRTTSMTFN